MSPRVIARLPSGVQSQSASCRQIAASNGGHVVPGPNALYSVSQAKFADGGDLVGDGFPLFVLQSDVSFRGVHTPDIAGERHDLNAVQDAVRRIIADNHRGPRLAISPPIAGSKATHQTSPRWGGGLRSGVWVIGYVARQILTDSAASRSRSSSAAMARYASASSRWVTCGRARSLRNRLIRRHPIMA